MSGSQINLAVTPTEQGLRLDQFLASCLPHLTRSQLQKWIKSGAVTVNAAARPANYRVRPGDELAVAVPEPEKCTLEPEPIALAILWEDEDLLVLTKPPGMTVHPGAGCSRGTLIHALLHHCPELKGIGGVQRPGLVHRLDKETSGVMVVAKTEEAHLTLTRQFAARSVEKRYVALVWGQVAEARGVINQPIGRHPQQRQKMSVQARRSREAVTSWERVRSYGGSLTLVGLQLHTGRTHQIRVHMAAMGHPVVGDKVSGGGARRLEGLQGELAALREMVSRHLLHARELRFVHPRRQEQLTCTAPLTADFQAVLDFLDERCRY
jgi:23S rRNA pseudouridine1911/1915/1917 synthase